MLQLPDSGGGGGGGGGSGGQEDTAACGGGAAQQRPASPPGAGANKRTGAGRQVKSPAAKRLAVERAEDEAAAAPAGAAEAPARPSPASLPAFRSTAIDGYSWRKYGQKAVRRPAGGAAASKLWPRSYYKCTYIGCEARKMVEPSATDPSLEIVKYKGEHNHGPVILLGPDGQLADVKELAQAEGGGGGGGGGAAAAGVVDQGGGEPHEAQLDHHQGRTNSYSADTMQGSGASGGVPRRPEGVQAAVQGAVVAAGGGHPAAAAGAAATAAWASAVPTATAVIHAAVPVKASPVLGRPTVVVSSPRAVQRMHQPVAREHPHVHEPPVVGNVAVHQPGASEITHGHSYSSSDARLVLPGSVRLLPMVSDYREEERVQQERAAFEERARQQQAIACAAAVAAGALTPGPILSRLPDAASPIDLPDPKGTLWGAPPPGAPAGAAQPSHHAWPPNATLWERRAASGTAPTLEHPVTPAAAPHAAAGGPATLSVEGTHQGLGDLDYPALSPSLFPVDLALTPDGITRAEEATAVTRAQHWASAARGCE